MAVGLAAISLAAAKVHARQSPARDPARGLPESPPLTPPPSAPGLGSAPGALEPSAFAPPEATVIGGRARSGAGRIMRKVAKPGHAQGTVAGAHLPAALPDAGPATDGSGATASVGSIVEDPGAPGGLTLDAALARMMAANLDLLALKYEIPQADADILTASLRANPLIYGDAQLIPYGRYTSQRPVGPTEYDVNITYPVDVSHKRKSRIEVARAAKTALEAQLQDAVRRQIGNLYRAFVDLQAARLGVLASESAVAEQSRVIDRARRKPGAEVDVAKLDAQLQKARDSLGDARDAYDDAREAIALLMNLPTDEAATLQPSGGLRDQAPAAPPLEELVPLALNCRPDLVAARRGIKRAESEIKLAKANGFNDVFLFYSPLGYQDNRISRQPSGRSWTMGLTIPLPLYDRNQGNIARARSNATQTQFELAALERRVASEVRLAEREYRTSRQVLERAESTTLPAARQARVKAAADFAAGTMNLSDYLDSLDDENDAARACRDALIRHRRSMLDLNTAVGVRLLP
jgi:outer membrane protein, heavy metal efflux system